MIGREKMNKKSKIDKPNKIIWLVSVMCLSFIICFGLAGNIYESIANAKEEQKTVLEEIQEISMTEEQFELVEYYKAPQMQLKAITKNVYDSDYGFSLLSDSEKKVYKKLEMACVQFQNSDNDAQNIEDENVAVGIELEDEELSKDRIAYVVVGFIYDHPQYFWTKGYSYWIENESDDVKKIVLECDENYLDGKKRYELWKKMEGNIEKYLDNISGIKDDYSKELIIHDSLAKQLSYAYSSSGIPETSKWAHNIEGAFSEEYNKVVCEGYAKAFQLLLNAAGIENIYIVGNGKTGGSWQGHAWNQVKIENAWYLVDLTWNDGAVISRRYFNLNQAAFSTNHVPFDQKNKQVARWCYELEEADGSIYTYEQQGEYYKKNQQHQLNYLIPKQFELSVSNQGVEVLNGSQVEEGTKLDFELVSKEENSFFDGVLTIGTKTYELKECKDVYKGSFIMDTEDLNLKMYCSNYMPAKELLNYVTVPDRIVLKRNQVKYITLEKPKLLKTYHVAYSLDNKRVANITDKGMVEGRMDGNAELTIAITDDAQNTREFKVDIIVEK